MAAIQRPTSNSISQGQHGRYKAIDFRARSRWSATMNRKNIYAVEDGTITSYKYSGTMGNRLELTSADGKRRWGMGHLERAIVSRGKVKRGQLIGIMGHTGYTIPNGYYGTHIHLVCNVGGVYIYPGNLFNTAFRVWTPAPPKPTYAMPKVGSKIKLTVGTTRSTFRAGTTTKAGRIYVRNNSYIYTVRGYDKKYTNRILINSASAGGNGVALALYYTNGRKIAGWKQI